MNSYARTKPDSRQSAGPPRRAGRPAGAVHQLQTVMGQSPPVIAQARLDQSLNQGPGVLALARQAERLSNRNNVPQRTTAGAPVQRTGDEALFEMENQNLAIPHGLNGASPWAAFETALLQAGINTDRDLARFREIYYSGQEQNLPVFQVSRALWPNIAEHTQAYIDQGEDPNGGVVLTYMAARAAHLNDTNNPIARQQINLGTIATNRDLNRFLSLSRGIHLVRPTRYGPGTVTQSDEFPFASTYEGGNPDVSVHDVPGVENAGHGGALGAFYTAQGLRDRYKFRVVVI